MDLRTRKITQVVAPTTKYKYVHILPLPTIKMDKASRRTVTTSPLGGGQPKNLWKYESFFVDYFFKFKKAIVSKEAFTLQQTKMSPENHWLEDVFPTEIVPL